MLRYTLALSRRLGMGWRRLVQEMDSQEIAYQMALDLIDAEEQQARRAGVPTVGEVRAMPPGRRIGAKDPDWFTKLEHFAA